MIHQARTRGKSVVVTVGGVTTLAEIAFVAGSGQELVRQMIKEGPSLEEKIGVALPVTCFCRMSSSQEPGAARSAFSFQGSAGDFSCLALQGDFRCSIWIFGSRVHPSMNWKPWIHRP